MRIERRTYADAQLRALGGDATPKLTGYAAVFNVVSADLGGFTEIIKPEAFREAVARDDVVCLLNHDRNVVLGRTSAKTLALEEDDVGLRFEAVLPDTQAARDLHALVSRGDVRHASFAFAVDERGRHWERGPQGERLHVVTRVARLLDVSIVTVPAYSQTRVDARHWRARQAGESGQELRLEILRLRARSL